MRTVAIIQARMGSTRLPGKVLLDLAGKPMLAQQVHRLRQCTTLTDIMIATTPSPLNDPLVELARRENVSWFRGSEDDVLQRFVGAAAQARADVIVRFTADCPLVDPQITDLVVRELLDHAAACDYASNVVERTYPRGLDVEAFFHDTLLRFDRLATDKREREHVTVLPRSDRKHLFLSRCVVDKENNSDLRWTVDNEADFKVVRTIYEALGLAHQRVPYHEVVAYVRAHAELARLNEGLETWDPIRKTR
jgi:spore coat polysaccharide biosynthesis protein SpsF